MKRTRLVRFKLWLRKNQMIGYLMVSIFAFGFQYMRQNQIENKVDKAEQNAIHRTETAFALGISGLKQTAIVLETSTIEQHQQLMLIAEHCKRIDCQLPTELTQVKDLPKYTPIAETYFGVQQIMIEKSKEGN